MAEEFGSDTVHAGTPGIGEHADRYERSYSFSISFGDSGGLQAARYIWTAPRAFRVLGARACGTNNLTNARTIEVSVGGFDVGQRVASVTPSVVALGNLATGGSTSMTLGDRSIIAADESVQLTFDNDAGASGYGPMGVTVWGVFL